MNIIDTVLFDLDGTLIDTNDIIIESFKQTFKVHLPNILISKNKILSFIGPSLHQTFSEYVDTDEEINTMIHTYREYYKTIEHKYFRLYPNVIEVIKNLHENGYNLAIVTTKFRESAWPSFIHFKLDKYFKVFISLDEVLKPKPDRNPIDVALSHFKGHKQAIMIGDNKSDILAGKNAEILSCGVAWSLKGKDYLNEANPDYMLENMNDLLGILEEINKK